MHPSDSKAKTLKGRKAAGAPALPEDDPKRKFYSLPKRGQGLHNFKPTSESGRKLPEEAEPPSGLAAVWDRLRRFFFCPMFGMERALLLIVVPLGLALAILLAVTAVGR